MSVGSPRAGHVAARLVTHPEVSLVRSVSREVRHSAIGPAVRAGVTNHRRARTLLSRLCLLLGHDALPPYALRQPHSVRPALLENGAPSIARRAGELPDRALVSDGHRSVNASPAA